MRCFATSWSIWSCFSSVATCSFFRWRLERAISLRVGFFVPSTAALLSLAPLSTRSTAAAFAVFLFLEPPEFFAAGAFRVRVSFSLSAAALLPPEPLLAFRVARLWGE